MNKKKLLTLVGFTMAVLGTAFTAACNNQESGHQHSYTEVITTPASCTEAGEKTFTCDCGDVYTEAIPATGHNYEVENTIPANCTEAEKEHLKCGNCDDEKTQIKEGGQAALGHNWVTVSTIPATCDEPEKVVQSCDRDGCGEQRTVTKENGQPALGHNYVADESTRTQPDCTTDGGVTMKCDRDGCTESYWDVIPALGHTDDGTKNEVHNATCEEEGYTIHHCSVCDKDYKTDNVAPLGHDYQADGKVIASCDSIGYDKYTCSHGCGTEKRENVVQNEEHTFNEQGVCTRCDKSATEAMALIAKTTTPIEIVSVGKGNYEIYGMREKEHVVYIPYNVIEALVKQGVESIIINVGATNPSDPISVVAKIDGETKLTANFGAGQTGEVATIKIAENGQVASSINSDGIALTVYYHDNYLNKVNSYVVGLSYVKTFDSQDVNTWYQTSLEVSGTAQDKVHVFSGMEDQAYYKVLVRPELIKYYADQGAKKIKFSFISKEGQRVIFAVDCNGTALPQANYSLDVPELEITDELLQNGVNFRILFADCSLLPDWASHNFDKADGFKLQTLLVKDYNANDASTYFDSAASWTANATNNEFTFSNCDIGNNTIIKIRPEYFADLANKGYAQAVITLSSKSGQNLTFSVVLDQNYMARGSVSFTLDITDELKTNGISLPVYTSDNNGNADGFVMRIDKVYAFDENNPVTFIGAPGTDGVSYENNVWTYAKNANDDFNQQIIISKGTVAKWIADGYSVVTLNIVHKDGEILGTQGVQTQWTITLADYADSGYSFTAYIAPRNEQGGYGNITGFLVSAEFTIAYNEAKPETYIMVPSTDGITYADGVWTVAKTAAYAADFYQDITVRPETIAYWMEQGYAKMTIAVSAKSGESTTIMYDGGFAYTVTFTEVMKTEGYTFSHIFIAPRSEGGMTGFNVTLELVEAFDANKPEKFITAENTDGVSYADNVWTFDRTAAYAADYNQYFTVRAEAIEKWIADGYGKIIIDLKAKDGEVLEQNPAYNIVSHWEIKLADYVSSGFTDYSYIAPRGESGITGFRLIVQLVEAFDSTKPEKFISAADTEGITYANGVWTVAKTAAYAADFYQDIVVSGDAIAYWMEQGYVKMTFAVSAKSGESTTIMYDSGFAHTVTFTEAMKKDGYTFSHVFIAPRSESGMTGFNVTLTLTEAFSVSKIANCVTAEGTEGVTYADNSWTFAKTASAIDGSSDFYQDVVISGDLIAYWAELGYTNMSITISAKDGESFVLMDFTNPTNVEITDDIKTNGYTISHFYVAPRSGNGITGFVITIALS